MGKHGQPDPETRFWKQVGLMPDGCLVWKGSNGRNGTGQFCANSFTTTAHRWAWYFAHGAMPDDGVTLGHMCENNWCVNPDHLYETTKGELLKSRNEKKFREVVTNA